MSSVRFSYHRDPCDYHRVLCVARRILDNGDIAYGCSMNTPPRWIVDPNGFSKNEVVLTKMPGDYFTKKEGRRIAEARIFGEAPPGMQGVIPREEGVSPVASIMQDLFFNRTNRLLKRIAEEDIRWQEVFSKKKSYLYLKGCSWST